VFVFKRRMLKQRLFGSWQKYIGSLKFKKKIRWVGSEEWSCNRK
jgi:hypothetical protein